MQRFDANGAFLGTVGEPGADPGQFGEIYGVAADAGGYLYVADYENDRIQVFGPDGVAVAVLDGVAGAGALAQPVFLTLDAEGHLYVADEGNNRVLKLRLLPPLAPGGAGAPPP